VKKELLEKQSSRSEYFISVETFTYCLTSIGAKSSEEIFAAKIKQLTGECHCSPPRYTMLTLLAENAALRKANTMK
jgi:hypothetical protein